ncbi:Dabb family protein [Pararcticibacter amylolyticus]|uniref:Stress responsive alpha-beta barrel domain-containing protein n=1 Tax=Pararcticibacter amylolyticus TaxID=2173175 RepID=A0A2U2PB43_9SPHI|nr:Dabb family protein [Pararcticibacter amylolyticus]PWG78339.1 stress responsive alpha-beta barrel domain-containing protein [Pararcticibacter amylolyticus]
MNRTSRRKFLVTSTSLAIGTTALGSVPLSAPAPKHPVSHHVFFWLKNPGSKEDRDKLIDGLKTLSKIEAIKELRVGVVADTEKRDVIDDTWSVSELMFFDDLKAQASYQSHPLHLEFIKNCSHLWEKVLVYDVEAV